MHLIGCCGYGESRGTDQAVSRIPLWQLDRTIVIFTADNGLSLGDHGLMGKQNLCEFGGMHVPLVFAGPGIPKGKNEAFAYLFDVYPTVCELTGTPIPKEVEGRSLAPVITGRATKVRDEMFTAYRNCMRALRDEQWKLIRYPLVDKTQLFDLKADPVEMNDLSAKTEHAERVKAMLERMKVLQKEYDDPVPLTVDHPKSPEWTPPAADEKEGGQEAVADLSGLSTPHPPCGTGAPAGHPC